MYEVHWEASGLAAMLTDDRFPRWFANQVRSAHRQAWREWAALRGNSRFGLLSRFGKSAWSRFGFTPRSEGYARRQRRILGAEMPYQSPNRGKPDVHHARGQMRSEGVGWRVSLKVDGDDIISRLTLPGMRAMNFPQNAVYRREFLRLDHREQEQDWIKGRVVDLVIEAFERRARRETRRRL